MKKARNRERRRQRFRDIAYSSTSRAILAERQTVEAFLCLTGKKPVTGLILRLGNVLRIPEGFPFEPTH